MKTEMERVQAWFMELRRAQQESLDVSEPMQRLAAIGLALIALLDGKQAYISYLLEENQILRDQVFTNPLQSDTSFAATVDRRIN